MKILNARNRLPDQFLHRGSGFTCPLLIDLLDLALHLIEQPRHFALMLIRLTHNLSAGAHGFAQEIFLPDNIEVILQICRRRHGVHESGEISHAAHGLELFFVREKLFECDDINRLLCLVQVQHRLEDHLVFQLIKKRRRIVRVRTVLAALAFG